MKNSYLNRNGGCFHGSCKVLMGDGSYKKVKHIVRGDTVMTFDRKCVKVMGIMITKFPEGKTKLVKIGDLLITPFHPILFDNNWYFPKDIIKPMPYECTEVYTFAVESNHIILVNSVPCVCLGHNFKGPIIEHNFFGTNQILQDLEKFPSWKKIGVVELTRYNFYRNPVTDMIDGIIPNPTPNQMISQEIPENILSKRESEASSRTLVI